MVDAVSLRRACVSGRMVEAAVVLTDPGWSACADGWEETC